MKLLSPGDKWDFRPIGPQTIRVDQSVLETANDAQYRLESHDKELEFCIDEANRLFENSDISEALKATFIEWISQIRWHVYDLFKNRGVSVAKEVTSVSYGQSKSVIEFKLDDIGKVVFEAWHDLKRPDDRPCFIPVDPNRERKLAALMDKLNFSC